MCPLLPWPASAGVSVDTGSDIAKEAADVILLEKNLLVLEEGVEQGRVTHGAATHRLPCFCRVIEHMRRRCTRNPMAQPASASSLCSTATLR
jgi:hypothetical protein